MDREALIEMGAQETCKALGWQWPPIESDAVPSENDFKYAFSQAISAIESAGLKIMGREPTEEGLRLASDARAARVTAQFEKIVISTRIPVHKCRFVYQEIWDAAPTYTDKGE